MNYPVRIICVVSELSDAGLPLIQAIREYARDSGVIFQTRLYNSLKYSDDRNNITRLPAFHAYIKKAYTKTFFPNTRPIQHINESIEMYLKYKEAKAKRKEFISRVYRHFTNWIGFSKKEVKPPFQSVILDWP